ncbi:response regulator [Denitromonas iodatirespirans]|uniref:Response regulator transcription factor n=1 Tax=Denitromonas iodatirespirans TaxID=2795389 RepID=A0A944HBD1_DENI1|nr:response regulator transcription factor [Denitromonas iodatirespirans]MBT0961537.1 response regulator transcription factor [Denitromonas iodatirespirans]
MIRILLLDDHAIVRSGYRRLVDAEPDMRVMAEAATVDEAYAAARDIALDVAMVDLSLRGASGIEAIRRILARAPGIRVLVLSMHDSPGFVTQAFRAGAVGYLTKSSDPGELIGAIRQVAGGRRVLSPDVAQALANAAIEKDDVLSRLTPREFEVLRMAASGESPPRIASQMHLSHKTVLNHLSAVRQKLDTESDFSLLRLAARHGLVELPTPSSLPC